MDRRGFTLIELIVAMILAAIVGVAIYQALTNSQRVYQMQAERAAMNSNTRTAVALLPMELREMSATDPVDSDVIEADSAYVEYKAMRGLFFLCLPPTGNVLTLWGSPRYGLDTTLTGGQDSVVIFSEGNPGSRADNAWIHAGVGSLAVSASACPGPTAGTVVTVNSVTPGGGLSGVRAGAPVRSFEVVKVGTYTSGGSLWLGAQVHDGSNYGSIQPVLGPLAADGLQLVYYDKYGVATTDETQIARVDLRIIGQTSRPVYNAGDLRLVVDTLVTSIALRNNRR